MANLQVVDHHTRPLLQLIKRIHNQANLLTANPRDYQFPRHHYEARQYSTKAVSENKPAASLTSVANEIKKRFHIHNLHDWYDVPLVVLKGTPAQYPL
jgi:hypothetical protein